jgi:putative hydrolase of the HAD superfamily
MSTRDCVRAVYFDAVGTLIHPSPSASVIYAEVGARYGSRLTSDLIARRFSIAFAKQEEHDHGAGWRTSEAREIERWRTIVAEVLDDVRDPQACFAELYQHFAQPSAWSGDDAVVSVLDALTNRGYLLGLASNYDQRLGRVLAGLQPLAGIKNVIISSEIGWRKPGRQFFAAVCRQASLPPEQILYVGDDLGTDYTGAVAAGLKAVLIAPDAPDGVAAIRTLAELPSFIPALASYARSAATSPPQAGTTPQ